MKCNKCNATTHTLRHGMCQSCLNARSRPIEAFSDEELVNELKKRGSKLLK